MAIVKIKDLLEAGVHFGTKASLWHPRMKQYIYGKRNQIHIIDLKQTVRALIESYYFFSKLSRENKTVLFVGTKRQAKDIIRDVARGLGMPYVVERWLGGTLTNFETIRASIRRLDVIEREMAEPEFARQSKKAQARYARERRRILRNLEGVRNMGKLPDAMFVVDPNKEANAVHEARKLGIPVIGLVDTDCDPEQINLAIPGNDDGIRSIQAVVQVLLNGLENGRSNRGAKEADPAPADQSGTTEKDTPAEASANK